MIMNAGLRKLALTAHVACSVGWLGAVAGFLALAVATLTTGNAQMVRAGYLSMETIARLAIVPLSIASLVTGLVQALGTSWGLFRHYWILFKLLINVFASIVLLMYMRTLSYFSDSVAHATLSGADLLAARSVSPVLHAGAAVVLLLVATVLAVYKPRGITSYGLRKRERVKAAG